MGLIDYLTDIWTSLAEQLQPADVLDVLVVSVVVFMVLCWLRRALPRRVAALILGVGLAIVAAQFFGMVLTEMILQGLLLVVALASVILFQTDLRRGLERMLHWRPFEKRKADGWQRTIAALFQTCRHWSDERTGALLVLRGQDSWRTISGGVPLNGIVSEPLLYSLFHPATPGHDGAILIDQDRVVRFAAHLPLSTDPEVARWGGTRHAAAAGIAQHSDALAVVVSEETGRISVAEHGELEAMADAQALHRRLETFWRKHHAPKRTGRAAQWLGYLTLSIASLMVGAGLWWSMVYSDEVKRTYPATVEVRDLPEEYEVTDYSPSRVSVTVEGRSQIFEMWSAEGLVVPLDLSWVDEGVNRQFLDPTEVNVRSGLEVTRIEPVTVTVEVEQAAEDEDQQ